MAWLSKNQACCHKGGHPHDSFITSENGYLGLEVGNLNLSLPHNPTLVVYSSCLAQWLARLPTGPEINVWNLDETWLPKREHRFQSPKVDLLKIRRTPSYKNSRNMCSVWLPFEPTPRSSYMAPAPNQSRGPEVTAGTPTAHGARIKPKVTAGRRKSDVVQIRMAHRMSNCNIGMSETFKTMRVIVQNGVSACRKSEHGQHWNV